MNIIRLSQIITVLFSISCFAQVDWTIQNSGTTDGFYSIAYGDSQYVAVGYSGTILSSTDGMIWTQRSSGTTHALRSIIYAVDHYIIVGDSGTILASTDGVMWTSINSGTPFGLASVTYGDSQYVTVGNSGTILTSPDGTIWTNSNFGTPYDLTSVAYGDSQYVAVVGNATEFSSITILTSPDGTTWTIRILPFTAGYHSGYGLSSIVHGNSQYIIVGFYSVYMGSYLATILTSPDGITWTSRSPDIQSGWLTSIIYGNSQYVAVGDKVYTSTDGITWITRTSGTTNLLHSITYGNSQYVDVGESGTILTSPDAYLSIEKNKISATLITTLSIQYQAPNTLHIIVPQVLRSSKAVVSIYNMAGKMLYTSSTSATTGEARMKINTLPAGVYCLGIKANDQKRFAKFAVVR